MQQRHEQQYSFYKTVHFQKLSFSLDLFYTVTASNFIHLDFWAQQYSMYICKYIIGTLFCITVPEYVSQFSTNTHTILKIKQKIFAFITNTYTCTHKNIKNKSLWLYCQIRHQNKVFLFTLFHHHNHVPGHSLAIPTCYPQIEYKAFTSLCPLHSY